MKNSEISTFNREDVLEAKFLIYIHIYIILYLRVLDITSSQMKSSSAILLRASVPSMEVHVTVVQKAPVMCRLSNSGTIDHDHVSRNRE